MTFHRSVLSLTMIWLITACSESPPPAMPAADSGRANAGQGSAAREDGGGSGTAAHADASATAADSAATPRNASPDDELDFAPLQLNPGSGSSAGTSSGADDHAAGDTEQNIQIVIGKLQPLQVLLGKWRGTTRIDYDGFKAVDSHEWIWDLKSDHRQPALVTESDKSPYLRRARLTWNTETEQFLLEVTDGDGQARTMTGDFTEPVHEVVGSDDKLHKAFRLEFTQQPSADSEGAAGTYLWQIAIALQEQNRYLLEVSRRRGRADFRRFDTVSTQREGTSFARSDTDYAERTCIISEGLGTIEVSYKGRSYWVCCTGCKAAFEEDPETWITRAARRSLTPKP